MIFLLVPQIRFRDYMSVEEFNMQNKFEVYLFPHSLCLQVESYRWMEKFRELKFETFPCGHEWEWKQNIIHCYSIWVFVLYEFHVFPRLVFSHHRSNMLHISIATKCFAIARIRRYVFKIIWSSVNFQFKSNPSTRPPTKRARSEERMMISSL